MRAIVITLTGTNYFARTAALQQLISNFTKKYSPDGVERYEGENLTAETLASALGGVSLFAQNRLVIITQLSAAKALHDQFVAALDTITDEVTIVAVEPTLDKRTGLYKALKKTDFREFNDPSEQELQKWVMDQVTEQGGTIDTAAARLLVQYCGTDQTRLGHELDKLVSHNPKVTTEAVEQLVEPNPADTIFTLLEQALGGRRSQAIKTLLALEQAHEDPHQIASMLVWQAHIMAVVHSALVQNVQSGEVARAHKINPYVISKTTRLVDRMPLSQLKGIINQVAALDLQLKSSSYDPWRTLEHTILSL